MKLYSPTGETELHCDTSRDGYGAVLLQKDLEDGHFHPVFYMSKKTNLHERNYSSYELEVMETIKKFRVYLLKFKIVSDCAAFKQTMQIKDIVPRIARWALLLEEYDYIIEHRPDIKMVHCDALSRNPITMIIQDTFLTKMRDIQKSDKDLKRIILLLDHRPYHNYIEENDLLYAVEENEKRLVIPRSLQHELIVKDHGIGHFGYKKTEELLKREDTFTNMKTKIEEVIRNCVHCILADKKRVKREGFLMPIEKGETPLHTWHVDHLGPMTTTSKGYKYVLVIVDAFSVGYLQ